MCADKKIPVLVTKVRLAATIRTPSNLQGFASISEQRDFFSLTATVRSMSLITWVPGEHSPFANQMNGFRDSEDGGYQFVEEWFGEDGYDRGPLFWLQLQKTSQGDQRAILRAYKGKEVRKITEEWTDDAVAFLKWDGYTSEEGVNDGVILYPEQSSELHREQQRAAELPVGQEV